VPQGEALTAPYPLAQPERFRVTVGGVDAFVQFVGMTFAGVFQINIQIPADVEPGFAPVRVFIDETASPDGVSLAIAPSPR